MNIAKTLFAAVCICLSGCALMLDRQQAMIMPAGDLCTFELNYGYSEVARNAIAERKLNCEKVILAEAKNVIPTMNSAELCAAETRNAIPFVYPLIQKEIARRKIDCLGFMQMQQQISIAQQQAASQRGYQERILDLERAATYKRPTTTNCRPTYNGGMECTSEETGLDPSILNNVKSLNDYMQE